MRCGYTLLCCKLDNLDDEVHPCLNSYGEGKGGQFCVNLTSPSLVKCDETKRRRDDVTSSGRSLVKSSESLCRQKRYTSGGGISLL